MRVFLAGCDDNPKCEKQFAEAEQKLIRYGYDVVNPKRIAEKGYRKYVNECLYQLMQCDMIYLIKGWRKSRMSVLARQYAMVCDLYIVEEVYEDGKRVRKCRECGD